MNFQVEAQAVDLTQQPQQQRQQKRQQKRQQQRQQIDRNRAENL